jgi:hypothetical protein
MRGQGRSFAALALAVALAQGVGVVPALAAERAYEVVEGRVTKIDLENTRVTVQSRDGSVHEFKATSETLKDLKVGDRIQAKRQPKSSASD